MHASVYTHIVLLHTHKAGEFPPDGTTNDLSKLAITLLGCMFVPVHISVCVHILVCCIGPQIEKI